MQCLLGVCVTTPAGMRIVKIDQNGTENPRVAGSIPALATKNNSYITVSYGINLR